MSGTATWHFMQDGTFDILANYQSGGRGGSEFAATNWWMGMWSRPLGRRQLTLTTMLSLDALTAGKDGYRELFQVGEILDGKPLVDRQHPHDFLAQASVWWRTPLGENTGLTLVGALAGEPAIGPPAFMHRPSVAALPFAPLSHHVFDSTHISFGVVTAVLDRGPWLFEASAFNGREPDDDRWGLDLGPLDSTAVRATVSISNWTLQASTARLVEPEALEEGNAQRTSATGWWFRPLGDGLAAATFGYGRNDSDGGSRQAVFGEGTLQRGRYTLSSRAEWAEVETSLLLGEGGHHGGEVDPVGAFTVGVARNVARWRGVSAALAVAGTLYVPPAALKETHGSHPGSVQVFLRFWPAATLNRMWNMRMGPPRH